MHSLRHRWVRFNVVGFAAKVATFAAVVATSGCASTSAPVAPAPQAAAAKTVFDDSLSGSAERTVDPNTATRKAALDRLRSAGPAGLDALAKTFASERKQLLAGETSPYLSHIRTAFEQVAKQRDAHASLLYWHTDLESAQAEAAARGLPILSLRMLGQLDQELSCANSRFFRVALYANDSVQSFLRDHYVLHWSSERPVPKITVEMGDGRRLVRTLTGNSIHYVLDDQGRPLDALPGLYGPKAFQRGLERAHALAAELRTSPSRAETLSQYHRAAADALAVAWQIELAANDSAPPLPAPRASKSAAPSAAVAVPTAMPKAVVEGPLVQAMQLGEVVPLPTPTSTEAWEALVALHQADAALDASSRQLMQVKSSLPTEALNAQIARFERMMAEDTVRNEYAMHRTLHEWLALSPAPEALPALNKRVYAELFLTPRTDPWLGLVPSDGYSAIEGDGFEGEAASTKSPAAPLAQPQAAR